MAFLDIMILDDKDNEVSSIRIDSQTHQSLFRLLGDATKYRYLYRMEDFYEDSRFDPMEVDDLRKEITDFLSEVESRNLSSKLQNVTKFLKDFQQLCEKARNLNRAIQCFSD
ncbi:MAG: hypothetical protein DKINENOH_03938 [bacterium]|nr:hypothetical protein [bacterium]